MEGNVKFYNRDKRFGFIKADDEKEYFFHESGLAPGTNVRDEDRVSFEVVEGDRGPKAEQIKLLTGEETPVEEPKQETTEEEDTSIEEEDSFSEKVDETEE